MCNSKIQEENIVELKQSICNYISGKRYRHTLAVEEEILSLCKIFKLDENETLQLRAAALLHDITKEKKTEEQIAICEANGIPYGESELASPKVFHAMTAPAIIKSDFSRYYIPDIVSSVRWHTTGKSDMMLGEKLLYLADYIEPTRDFHDCIALRKFFYESNTCIDIRHLNQTLILSFEMTIRNLLNERAQIHPQTVISLNSLLKEEQE